MNSKEKQQYRSLIILILFLIINLIIFYLKFVPIKESFATKGLEEKDNELKISSARNIDLDKIIENNTNIKTTNTEEIYEKQEELEYITKYRYNDELYVGTTQVSQEGRSGIQTITIKRNFDSLRQFN